MGADLFSPSWYRVAHLKPRLRAHASLLRQTYRGETWYVLQDLSSERFHRFTPATYAMLGLMDGQRTVQQLWELTASRLGDDAPTQEEVVRLLAQLHAADVLQCDVPPDTMELFQRHEQRRRRARLSKASSVLAWKFPFLDPDRLLTRLLPLFRPWQGRLGALLWLAIVIPAAVLAGVHWRELGADILDQAFAPHNVLLLWAMFPVIKLLHELGHGMAVKAFGGEVHEMGVMVLVLTPVPYVDASSSWAFRSKWRRILVGGAGMGVELFLASLALYLWLNVEPGLVRLLAYNTMLIAGISTIIFNANPLLRFDGYYMLADFLEIPNLRQRSFGYLGYLCERYLFGRRETERPRLAPGERGWFVGYALSSFAYRVLVIVGILLFLGDLFFTLALLFATAMAVMWIAVPLGHGVKFLFTSPRLQGVRVRAVAVSATVVVTVTVGLTLVPAPLRTITEGVVWVPDEAFVRAQTDGFVTAVVAAPGETVEPGTVLIVCEDPALSAEVESLEARLRELQARYNEQRVANLVKAEIIHEELRYTAQALERARERQAQLIIRSRTRGTFVAPRAQDLPGRYVKRGEALGHVVELAAVTVRAVIPQADIDLVRHHTAAVTARLIEAPREEVPARIVREVPAAREELPTPALGSGGGGRVATDPRDPKGVSAVQKVFQLDLELASPARLVNVGGRVFVRFDHGAEPLGEQWYRRLRQLFLSRYNV